MKVRKSREASQYLHLVNDEPLEQSGGYLFATGRTMTEQDIKEMIQAGDMHLLYGSRTWERLAGRARKRQHNECQRCKAKGFYAPCEVVHHKKYVKDRPDLALDIDNLECLCRECHEKEHGREREEEHFLNEERW